MSVDIFSRQFEYFLKASEFSSMREAAHYLGVTQPALSHAIALLEDELGVKLFERSRKGVILTAEGSALVKEFKTFRGDALNRIKKALREPVEIPLRIGCQEHFFRTHLYPYLRTHGAVSKHKLYLGSTFECQDAVAAGEVDFAFCIATERPKGLIYRPIKQDAFYVVGLTKRYAHIARAKSMDDLKDEIWIDGKYPGVAMFSDSVSIVVEGMQDFKTCLWLGLGIGTAQWDIFTEDEQKRLTRAPFVPNANSPEHPLVPPGKQPVVHLVHKAHVSNQAKREMNAMLRYFLKHS